MCSMKDSKSVALRACGTVPMAGGTLKPLEGLVPTHEGPPLDNIDTAIGTFIIVAVFVLGLSLCLKLL